MSITSQSMKKILEAYEDKSSCTRASVASVIVRDGRVISTGYVGSPSGMPHCKDVGCLIGPDGGCIRTVHAEANAIAFAARHGISTDRCDMVVSISPCLSCAKLIINAGIKSVSFYKRYRNTDGIQLLEEAGVEVYDLSE